MNESLQQSVSEVLDYLLAVQHEGVRPREARARLQPLRGRHPDLEIDLLAEEQAFDQSFHYDALLRRPGVGTVSLSYCPERVVPWPLRGVHRWSEGDLVRVNANILQVDAAMACLDFIWDDAAIIERLVNTCLVQEEVARRPIELTDAELQEAMNKFRSAKKLFKSEDTLRWLERHGMSQEMLERYVSESAIVPKLRDRIAGGGQVEEYFRQHQPDFDTAQVARIEVAREGQARELAEQIRGGAQNFFAAAERVFFEAAERGALQANLFAMIERRDAEPVLRDQLFAAATGQLVGPVPVEGGFALMRVSAIIPARLDARTHAVIKDTLFKNWLAEQRQAAQIEWCWGNAGKTAART